jgi:toxin ParE1/3/4
VDDLSAREGYRRYLAGSHVIFFRKIKSGIDAIRILHGGMDFEQHL